MLHDLFPLTGRCAHPKGCERVLAGCDAACPTPDEFPQLAPSRIAAAHAEKRAVLADPRGPLLLANSAWTERTARRLAPPAALVACALGTAVGLRWRPALAVPATYLAAVTAGGLYEARREEPAVALRVPAVVATMHMAWGWGFLTSPAALRREIAGR